MQIYSTADPHWMPDAGSGRKLSAATRRSHGFIPIERIPGPIVALAFIAMIAASGCAGTTRSSAGTRPDAGADAGAIDSADLSRDLHAFADDSMRGRETGTPDADRAARFIATRLKALGLEPVGDTMFFQRVPMMRQVATDASRVTITRGGTDRALQIGVEITPMMSLGDGQPDPRRQVDADVVFAGYAITATALNRDDFKSINLEDQVVVLVHGSPPGVTGALKDSLNSEAEMGRQLARVAIQRPAAIVILLTGDATSQYSLLYPSLMRDVHGTLGAPPVLMGVQIPMILFGLARQGSPLLPAGWPGDDRAQKLTGTHFTADIQVNREPFTGYNVIGKVPGTDPTLRGTYVALGAHYDHVGILPPQRGDSIANGADDDGSGSVALLAIAKAMVRSPARRSTLFVWHVGEEKGLLGSAYFTAHPTVPIDSIVAQLNADMIGRNQADSLYVVGPGAAPNGQSRHLGQVIDTVNARQSRPFVIDRSWDVADHPLQIYQRSDHFNYAKKGIPIAFFTTGMHPDYHEVGDDASRIDYAKLARVSRLMLDVARAIGNAASRPR